MHIVRIHIRNSFSQLKFSLLHGRGLTNDFIYRSLVSIIIKRETKMIDFLVKLALPPKHNHIQFHPYLVLEKNKKKKKKPKYKILIYLNEIHPKQLNLMLLSMYQSFRHTHTHIKQTKEEKT